MIRFLAALFLAMAVTTPLQAQDATPVSRAFREEAASNVLAKAVDDFIRPGYRNFLASTETLGSALDALCTDPTPKTMERARHAFAGTVAAWSRIEIVRVGPVIENNRFERILFYPDRKSTGLKQVQAALATQDESTTSVKTLKEKSVAMQGLGALEFLLHGTGHAELLAIAQSYRCRYGSAVAANLERLAGELVNAWENSDGVQEAWKNPGPDNPVFRTHSEAVTALLGILVHAGEAVRDQRIETFYKGQDARAFPRQAIYWRSGLTFRSIDDNLAGIKSLIEDSDMAELLEPDARSIVGSIQFVLKTLSRATRDLDGMINSNVERAVNDEQARAKLDFLLLNAKDLILRLNDDYGGAVGLGAGFSFSDGD